MNSSGYKSGSRQKPGENKQIMSIQVPIETYLIFVDSNNNLRVIRLNAKNIISFQISSCLSKCAGRDEFVFENIMMCNYER